MKSPRWVPTAPWPSSPSSSRPPRPPPWAAEEAAADPLLPGAAGAGRRYGGAATLGKKLGDLGYVAALAMGSPAGHFAVVFVGGLGSFFVWAFLFTFLLFNRAVVAIVLLLVFECVCARYTMNRHGSPYHYPLGANCAASALLGALAGVYGYDTYGYPAFMYSRSRNYENVVPLEHAGAVADAASILFSDEAHVDVNMSAGYLSRDGHLYCAAPVRGADNATEVEFWAVGKDCCDSLGAFTCESAGDAAAHGARVVLSDGGYFTKYSTAEYQQAREKAEANFNLHSPGPLYVQWIPSEAVPKVAGGYALSACGLVCLATLAYAVLSAAFVWILCKSFMQSFMPTLDYGVF